MKQSLYPAIITAIAGIFGILINVLVNTWYRHTDSRVKRKEADIDALQSFFLPLCGHLKNLQISIDGIKKVDNDIAPRTLSSYLNRSKTTPANLVAPIEAFNEKIQDISSFVAKHPRKFISDYKSMYYFDIINTYIGDMEQSRKNHFQVHTSFFGDADIVSLVRRVDCMYIKLSTTNWFARLYLSVWKLFQARNRKP